MTDEQIILNEVSNWLMSDKLKQMRKGYAYYKGKNDILFRPRQVIGEYGKLKDAENMADNRIAHPFLRELCDQKTGYLLGKPLAVSHENKDYTEKLDEYLKTMNFQDALRRATKDSIIAGIGWLHFYLDGQGELQIMNIDPTEIIPLWKDEAHTMIDRIIRVYQVTTYESTQKVMQTWVTCWSQEKITHFILQEDVLIINPNTNLPIANIAVDGVPHMWDNIPFIPIKYNDEEQPLLELIKTLIDEYDRTVSEDANALADQPNSVLVIRNYDGQDLGEFRRNLSTFRAVKVSDDGGLTALSTPVTVDSSNVHLERLRRDIYAFGRGVDMRNDVIGQAVSGVALRQAYATLDLDSNNIETLMTRSLYDAMWFINTMMKEPIETIPTWGFNRDIINVEAEAIEMCKNSEGIVSDRTILQNHPWVTDVQEEMDELEAEKQKQQEDFSAGYSSFAQQTPIESNHDIDGGELIDNNE